MSSKKPSDAITSTQNPLVKKIAALREAKGRREEGLAVIDGYRETLRAHQAGIGLRQVVFCLALARGVDLSVFKGVEIIEVNQIAFAKIAYGDRQDGVIGVMAPVPLALSGLKLSKAPLVIVLESVEKPGNLGAVLRTCDAVGADALLVCDAKVDVYNPNVIRSSTGAVFTVPTVCAAAQDILAFLKKNSIQIIGTFPGAKTNYTQAPMTRPTALVLGAEDKGLSSFWQTHCEIKVAIPMKGMADSLNVSVSAAVIAFEALRQRSR